MKLSLALRALGVTRNGFLWLVLLLFFLPRPVTAQSPEVSVASTWEFDMPAMPLSRAIDIYANTTGISVAVEVAHMYTRTHSVSGRMTAEQALHTMLLDTGLLWRSNEPGAVMIYAPTAPAPVTPLPLSSLSGHELAGADRGNKAHRRYAASVQETVFASLCNNPRTRPGSYRLLIQIRVNNWGQVVQHRRLDTSGNTATDKAIDQILAGLRLGSSPPPGLQQPIFILLLPFSATAQTACP